MISTCRLLFRELNLRVQTLSRKVDRYGNDVDHSSRFGFEFEKWFRHYDSVCTLVGKINRCFGLILVVTLSHSVVISIRYGTMVVAMAESKNPNRCTVAVFFLIRVLSLLGIHIRLWAIIIKSHQMYVEVRVSTWKMLQHISANTVQLKYCRNYFISLFRHGGFGGHLKGQHALLWILS